jgi:hypothetical protein
VLDLLTVPQLASAAMPAAAGLLLPPGCSPPACGDAPTPAAAAAACDPRSDKRWLLLYALVGEDELVTCFLTAGAAAAAAAAAADFAAFEGESKREGESTSLALSSQAISRSYICSGAGAFGLPLLLGVPAAAAAAAPGGCFAAGVAVAAGDGVTAELTAPAAADDRAGVIPAPAPAASGPGVWYALLLLLVVLQLPMPLLRMGLGRFLGDSCIGGLCGECRMRIGVAVSITSPARLTCTHGLVDSSIYR